MFDADVDTSRLMLGIRELAKVLNRDVDEVLKDQAKIMVGQLVGTTPPAAPGGADGTTDARGRITSKAKKFGEAAVKADIAKLFPTTRKSEEFVDGLIAGEHAWDTSLGPKRIKQKAFNIGAMARLHKKARSPSTGRVRVGRSREYMAISRTAIRNEYQKRQAKKVGKLAAGWIRAARKLKAPKRATPAWITRNGVQAGGITFRKKKDRLVITLSNNMGYFPRDIERRLGYVIKRRTYGLVKQMDSMMDRKIRKNIQKYF